MKKFIKQIIKQSGFELRRIPPIPEIGTHQRSVGNMSFLLEDIKIRGLKCNNILDVGANNTLWSREAKRIFPNANFCLIEPQVEMKVHLEQFCKDYEHSTYFLAGAGPKADKMVLTIWEDLAGSSLLPKASDKLINSGKQREIVMVTIDDLIESAEIKMPDLIKMDIQGFELEALKGAEKTFGQTEVYILETSLFPFNGMTGMPVLSDVIFYMLERDYVVYDFPGFLRRPFDGALGQCDICFVKKHGFLRSSNSWN